MSVGYYEEWVDPPESEFVFCENCEYWYPCPCGCGWGWCMNTSEYTESGAGCD